MVLFVVSLSKVASPAIINGEGQFFARHLSSMPSTHYFWRNPTEKKEFKARRQLLNTLRWHGTSGASKVISPTAIKNITIQTCGPLYEEWRETRKAYAGAPKEGLSFNVEYVDTKEYVANDKAPVILTLHGSPGSHQDFHPLINHLAPKGVRIIAPNWPVYSAIDRTKYFRHSSHEKREYLKDFLKAIDIDRLDMLVTHSSAVFPALDMCINERFPVNSYTLINPAGHRKIIGMKPAWFIDNLIRFTLNPTGRAIFRKLGKYIFALKGVPVRTDSLDDVIHAGTVMFLSESERLSGFLETLRQQKPNLLYIYSENDKLVEKQIFYEMAQILDAKESQYSKYDAEGNCIVRGSQDDWMKIIQFAKGGHYAFLKFSNIVNPAIEELLDQVTRHKQQVDLEVNSIGCQSKQALEFNNHSSEKQEEQEKLVRKMRF